MAQKPLATSVPVDLSYHISLAPDKDASNSTMLIGTVGVKESRAPVKRHSSYRTEHNMASQHLLAMRASAVTGKVAWGSARPAMRRLGDPQKGRMTIPASPGD